MAATSVLYRRVCASADKLMLPLLPHKMHAAWHHPAGPKTVFFWAPTIKWSLVGAGIADMMRPADKLSIAQSSALAATGTIWARYCLVISPVNYYLCSVNVFVGLCGYIQMFRALNYQYSHKEVKTIEK